MKSKPRVLINTMDDVNLLLEALATNNKTFTDSGLLDAFGRLRVANPELLIDLKRVGGVPDIFADNQVTGSATAVYDSTKASTLLSVASGESAIRQSKQRAIYQPGKSIQTLLTFEMDSIKDGLIQRVGLFDSDNGVFLEQSDDVYLCVRDNGSDTKIAQANWNVNTLESLDLTKSNILMMDFEWLGVGRVRYYFVIDGVPVLVHCINNANNIDDVYMSNPNLPLRWEISSTNSSGALRSICGTVASEGGYQVSGITSSTNTGATGKIIASSDISEVLAVRIQDAYKGYSSAFAQAASVINSSSGDFLWQLVLNPTETVAGTWSSVTDSIMEKNTTRTVTEGTGIVIDSGYVSGDLNSVQISENPVLRLGTKVDGTQDILSLQVRNLSVSQETYYSSVSWRELY